MPHKTRRPLTVHEARARALSTDELIASLRAALARGEQRTTRGPYTVYVDLSVSRPRMLRVCAICNTSTKRSA